MKRKFISILIGIFLMLTLTGCEQPVKIVKSETSVITYEDYNNGLVSMKIPTGWKVEIAKTDYIHYSFKVYNPNDKNYMFLFGLKQEGFLKSDWSCFKK